MTKGWPIERRQFLKLLMGTGAGTVACGLGLAAAREVSNRSLEGRLLEVIAVSAAAARSLGAEYMALVPDEASRDIVFARLVHELGWRARLASPDGLRELVAQRISKDYTERRIMTVDHWIMSRTELRLCALAFVHESYGRV